MSQENNQKKRKKFFEEEFDENKILDFEFLKEKNENFEFKKEIKQESKNQETKNKIKTNGNKKKKVNNPSLEKSAELFKVWRTNTLKSKNITNNNINNYELINQKEEEIINNKNERIIKKYGHDPVGLQFIIGFECKFCKDWISNLTTKKCNNCKNQIIPTIKVKYTLEEKENAKYYEEVFEYMESEKIQKLTTKYTKKNIIENMNLFWNIMRFYGDLNILKD